MLIICISIFSGFVEHRHIENYKLFRGTFSLKCQKNSNFQRAVQEMDNFILDPQKYRSNAFAHRIKIKKECGSVDMKTSRQHHKSPKENQSKSNLISDMVSLKNENHHILYDLNEKKRELADIKTKNDEIIRELKENIRSISSDLANATAELKRSQKHFSEQRGSDEKKIADLISEKKILTARINQLQSTVIVQQTDENDEEVYEVDKIIDDKLFTEHRYLIRWKGYDAQHDSWEKPENLLCPSILEDYRKSKQMSKQRSKKN